MSKIVDFDNSSVGTVHVVFIGVLAYQIKKFEDAEFYMVSVSRSGKILASESFGSYNECERYADSWARCNANKHTD